jgi:hypothetical protein
MQPKLPLDVHGSFLQWRAVAKKPRHHRRWISGAFRTSGLLNGFPDLGLLLTAQLDVRGCHILLQILDAFRAWDGDEVVPNCFISWRIYMKRTIPPTPVPAPKPMLAGQVCILSSLRYLLMFAPISDFRQNFAR